MMRQFSYKGLWASMADMIILLPAFESLIKRSLRRTLVHSNRYSAKRSSRNKRNEVTALPCCISYPSRKLRKLNRINAVQECDATEAK